MPFNELADGDDGDVGGDGEDDVGRDDKLLSAMLFGKGSACTNYCKGYWLQLSRRSCGTLNKFISAMCGLMRPRQVARCVYAVLTIWSRPVWVFTDPSVGLSGRC